MTGRSRRSARGPAVLPWRTALVAAALGGIVLGTAPESADQAELGLGYGAGDLRAMLSGATPAKPAPVAASGPEAFVRELPEAGTVLQLPAEGPGLAPAAHDVSPASFSGARGR